MILKMDDGICELDHTQADFVGDAFLHESVLARSGSTPCSRAKPSKSTWVPDTRGRTSTKHRSSGTNTAIEFQGDDL
jgi:hypothetical protein